MVDYRLKAESAVPPQKRWHAVAEEPIPTDREVWLLFPNDGGVFLASQSTLDIIDVSAATHWHESTKPEAP